MIHRVSVFCSSSSLVGVQYKEATTLLAKQLVRGAMLIQYGGGKVGLMGCLADTVLKAKGRIRGVIPRFMVDEGWVHPGVTDMVVVKSMAVRKHQMMLNTDAIIALPGGFGTLEELTEAITLKQLGLLSVPILILNINGFYDPLLGFFNHMKDENFIREQHHKIWTVFSQPEEVIRTLHLSTDWDSGHARATAAL